MICIFSFQYARSNTNEKGKKLTRIWTPLNHAVGGSYTNFCPSFPLYLSQAHIRTCTRARAYTHTHTHTLTQAFPNTALHFLPAFAVLSLNPYDATFLAIFSQVLSAECFYRIYARALTYEQFRQFGSKYTQFQAIAKHQAEAMIQVTGNFWQLLKWEMHSVSEHWDKTLL